jgi:hypothetical protein
MRLIRFGEPGHEKPGLLQEDGIVDLGRYFKVIPDIGEAFFREGWLARIAAGCYSGRAMEVRYGAPVIRPSKIICLGKNYVEHAREGGFEVPEAPLLFCKSPNTLNGPFDPVPMPRSSSQIDWEVELAVIIGREGKRIAGADAMAYIAGYSVFNDVSGRQAQFAHSQWFRGKSLFIILMFPGGRGRSFQHFADSRGGGGNAVVKLGSGAGNGQQFRQGMDPSAAGVVPGINPSAWHVATQKLFENG